jgi:hypothetical protein
VRQHERAARAVGRFDQRRRREHRPHAQALHGLERRSLDGRCEVDEIALGDALPIVGGRLRRKRLRRGRPFERHVGLRHGALFDRPERLARGAVERIRERLFRELYDGLHGPAVHRHVEQDRRRGVVPVPDIVPNELSMPDALARPHVDGNQAVAEQVVAVALAAVHVARRTFDGQIDEAELRIGGHRTPHAGVTRVLGRARREPRVVTELAFLRDRMERPQELARARVESAHIELHLRLRVRPRADAACGTDDNHVADDERRRRGTGLDVIHRAAQAAPQVDDAGLAELAHGQPRVRVERPQIEPRRHRQHAPLVTALPVRDTASRSAARRRAESLAVARPPDPERLASAAVDGNDITRGSGRCIENAADHQRRGLALQLRSRAEVAAVPAPRNLQALDVARVDLVER